MEIQTNINLLVGITWLIMFGLFGAITIMYLNYRKKIEKKEKEKQIAAFKASVDTEERQKERIANNLHDEIIPLISSMIQNIDANTRDYQNGKFDIANLAKDKEVAIQLVENIRTVALELIPKVLLDLGFVMALNRHLKKMNTGVCTIEFENNTPFEAELPLDKSVEVNIYRLCLEILNNLVKHDHFTYLKVTITANANSLIISLIHDGKGITNEKVEALTETSGGLGLKSLRSRLYILKGFIDYSVDPEASKILVTIPLVNER